MLRKPAELQGDGQTFPQGWCLSPWPSPSSPNTQLQGEPLAPSGQQQWCRSSADASEGEVGAVQGETSQGRLDKAVYVLNFYLIRRKLLYFLYQFLLC